MELVVLSGKGGTGKTTIAAALSELSRCTVKVDCDVDAPNFYLFYKGYNIEKDDFHGGKKAFIDEKICNKCGICKAVCKVDAIKDYKVNSLQCEGCGACVLICPEKAISLDDEKSADVFVTKTDKGVISRAEMAVGSEGSGKLITILRKNGKKFADNESLTIVDGSPGIGCPVISSITGCDAALIVAEPTVSGIEDFMRVTSLCEHFSIPVMVCINKYDLNEKITVEIERICNEHNYKIAGKVPYDDTVIKSINEMKPVVYYEESTANKAIRQMWDTILNFINKQKQGGYIYENSISK